MKNIKFYIGILLLVVFAACDVETEDVITENAVEAGVAMRLDGSTFGKVTGSPVDPTDLDNSTIQFSTVTLLYKTVLKYGGENISKYQVYKSLNGGSEILVGESATLPMVVELNGIESFLEGTGVSNPNDLRIGDYFTFRTRIITNDGNEYVIHDGGENTATYVVNIGCESDLSGNYTNDLVPDCTGSNPITVTEDSPGRYFVSSMTGYNFGSGNCIGFYMVDTCGTLTYDGGDLEDNNYSGEGGTGVVNSDGSFTFTCKLNDVGYSETSTYYPQ